MLGVRVAERVMLGVGVVLRATVAETFRELERATGAVKHDGGR
jgi:hypothetical protein